MFKQARREFKTHSLPMQAAVLALAAALLCHCVFLAWVNLTQFSSHIDGDSSTQILKVMEIIKAGSFSLPNWHDTTTMLLDMPITPAVILYPLFHNVFTAYGTALFVLDMLLLVCTAALLQEANAPLWTCLTALLLLLCPYGHGAIQSTGYANSLVVQSGYYTFRILYLVLLLLSVLRLARGMWRSAGTWTAMAGAVFLALLCGVSSGSFLLLMVILPLLAFWVLWALAARQYRVLCAPAFLFLGANVLAVLAGSWAQHNVIHFASHESEIPWIGYTGLLSNLGGLLRGYLKLLDAMPAGSSVLILSKDGILYGIALVVALALPAGAVLALRRPAPESVRPGARTVLVGSCLCLICENLVIFCGASLTYGDTTYECRYLLFMTTAMILLLALSLPKLPLPGDLRTAVPALLCLCVVLNVARCDAAYSVPTYDFSTAQAVSDALDAAYPEVRVVYMQNDDHDRKVLRVTNTDKVYRLLSGTYNPGDYTYYQDGCGLEAGSLLLCTIYQYEAWSLPSGNALCAPACRNSGCILTRPAISLTIPSLMPSITVPAAA